MAKRDSLKTDYFSKIDTPTKAYLLGFYAADGCIFKHGKNTGIKISVAEKDVEIIKLYIKEIYPDANINISSRRKQIIKGKEYTVSPMVTFKVICNEIGEDLVKLGIGYRKTELDYSLPNISENLIHHFIRGYFDGDGHVIVFKGIRKTGRGVGQSYTNRRFEIVSNNSKILLDISEYFKKFDIDIKLKVHKTNYFCIETSSAVQIGKIYDILYSDAENFLKRKRDIFEIIKETSSAISLKKANGM